MNARRLIRFFETRRASGDSFVLASVYETSGSTYSKAGERMFIDGDGNFQGMLSGGCLEGDLGLRARVVIETGEPQTVTYDLTSENDELWGMGVGCEGLIRVFLQPVTAAENYEPVATILRILTGRERSVAATVVESQNSELPAGETLILRRGETAEPAWGARVDHAIRADIDAAFGSGQSMLVRRDVGGEQTSVLLAVVDPIPRLLVLGAGLDAEPVIRFAGELGWQCTVVDHRPAYIDNNDFADDVHRICCAADALSSNVDLDEYDLAIVMSHHLVSDRTYLEQLALSNVLYIGLLGPPGRRDRLLNDIGTGADRLRPRLHGPAGLDFGGRGPAAIALSIVAEMQSVLSERIKKD